MSWSIPLGQVGGVAVRVHAIFLLYIVIELLLSVTPPAHGVRAPVGFPIMAVVMGILVVVVIAHEFGRCVVCRLMRGEATEVLLWPLGGLAQCRPDHRWQAHLATALGGPMVTLVLCLLAGGMLWAITGRVAGVSVPNLLEPFLILQDVEMNLAGRSWALLGLYLVNLVAWVVLVLNLLPMFPLDGARILHALLWPRLGYVPAMRLVVRIGLIAAVLVAIYGVIMPSMIAVAVALFGAYVSWTTHRQLEFTESMLGYEAGLHEVEQVYGDRFRDILEDETEEPYESKTDPPDTQQPEDDQEQELDRILHKIARTGMESLTREEQALLNEETRRRRGDQ